MRVFGLKKRTFLRVLCTFLGIALFTALETFPAFFAPGPFAEASSTPFAFGIAAAGSM